MRPVGIANYWFGARVAPADSMFPGAQCRDAFAPLRLFGADITNERKEVPWPACLQTHGHQGLSITHY